MKKFALVLALVSMLTVCFASLNVSAAKPIDAFTQIEAPAEEDKIKPTSWNYFVGMNQLENPVGSWSWENTFQDQPGCWGMNNTTSYLDSDLKTVFWETKTVDFTDVGATTVKEIVFADGYTQSRLGNFGSIRAKQETFEKMTVIYSDDGENWSTVGFTVAYHTESSEYVDYYNKTHAVDTYWHLIFDEEVPAVRYFGFHTSETKAWDADDHIPALGIILNWEYTYLVKGEGDGTAVETDAATDADTDADTDAETDAETEPSGNPDTADFAVASAAVVAIAATGVVLCTKKRNR